jgi:hypothetical protein
MFIGDEFTRFSGFVNLKLPSGVRGMGGVMVAGGLGKGFRAQRRARFFLPSRRGGRRWRGMNA